MLRVAAGPARPGPSGMSADPAMLIKLTDPVRTDDLVHFLRRCDCTVDVVAPGLLEVEPRELSSDPTLRQPELELDAYLGLWSA